MNTLASILVVEPDSVFREALTRRLLGGGLSVTAVHHPRQALQAASFCDFDAAIIAELLPELPGCDLAAQLRRVIADLKIILLSDGITTNSRVSEFVSIVKPASVKDLTAYVSDVENCLDELLAQSRWQKPPFIVPSVPEACRSYT